MPRPNQRILHTHQLKVNTKLESCPHYLREVLVWVSKTLRGWVDAIKGDSSHGGILILSGPSSISWDLRSRLERVSIRRNGPIK